MKLFALLATLSLCWGISNAESNPNIVRDGEYYYLQSQFADKWEKEDAIVDEKLVSIHKANGGKPPNIIYILIDDVSFGQMGNRTLNYVTGVKTPNINHLATEGMSLMRMYTEPSCTPTRAAMLTAVTRFAWVTLK